MEHDTPVDPQEVVRLFACNCVSDMADRAASVGQFMFQDAETFVASAQIIEHYISNGQDVGFSCNDGSAKFVSGQQRPTA